jgi:16S rRNA G966 N2-methylase RsmD
MSFPFRKYTKNELLDEYFNLKNKLISHEISNKISYSRVGSKCSNKFFQIERMKTPSQGKISCYDYWFKNKKKIINYSNNSNKKSNDLFAFISFLNHPSAQFLPFIAGQIYLFFEAKKILDPYAGWGDRCLTAMALDIDYIGIDSNINLKLPYDKMLKYYPSNSNVEIIYDKCENIDIVNLDFDFVFTSPPYWNEKKKILEEYNNCETDYDIFLNNSLIPLIKNCKKKNNNMWICINMPNFMYKDVKKVIGKCRKILNFSTNLNNKSKDHSKRKINDIYCF